MPEAYLVGGFLGSGKTTFVIESLIPLLRDRTGRDITVIVNDYGEVGFDKIKYYQEKLQVLGIDGACICCSAGDALLRSLNTIKDSTSAVIIETSGVSSLYPVMEAVESSGYSLEMVFVCVSADIPERLFRSPLVMSQIELAQCVILTKADLVNDSLLRDRIRELQKLKKLFFLSYEGRVDRSLEDLLKVGADLPHTSSEANIKPDSPPRFYSYTIKPKGYYLREEVEDFFKKLPPEIYRAKGILHIAQSPIPLAFNYTCGYMSWERIDYTEESFLTFIGEVPCHPYLKDFPSPCERPQDLMIPITSYDTRNGIAYYRRKIVSERRAIKEVIKTLEKEDFVIVSAGSYDLEPYKTLRISDYSYSALVKMKENLEMEKKRVILLMKDIPDGVASFFVDALSRTHKIIHLGSRYLLPESYTSIKLNSNEKIKAFLEILSAFSNCPYADKDL